MPASQPHTDWRARWLPILFWIGVGLAPTAAVLLLVGQGGGPLRIAAVLAIFCVTLIGLSVALRNDVEQVRTEIESTVLDEADAIRDETREDIVAVARKLHAALRTEVADLAEQVAELRRQLSAQGGGGRVSDMSDEGSDLPRGVVRRTETYQVTRQTTVSSDQARRNEYATAGVASGRARPEPSRPSPGRAADSWSEPTRPYVDPGRAAAERRHWDPLSDDLAERPGDRAAGTAYRSPMAADPPTDGGGRRRAAEPDAPVPIAEIEAARPVDPWADLRSDTQPATVRFGANGHDTREPVPSPATRTAPTNGFSARGDAWQDEPTRDDARRSDPWSDEPTRDEPGPLDPGWRNSNGSAANGSSPYQSW
jgi:hypothetical protein